MHCNVLLFEACIGMWDSHSTKLLLMENIKTEWKNIKIIANVIDSLQVQSYVT